MKKIVIFLLSLLILSNSIADEVLSFNGKDIILHEDFSWEYKMNNSDNMDEIINLREPLLTINLT